MENTSKNKMLKNKKENHHFDVRFGLQASELSENGLHMDPFD